MNGARLYDLIERIGNLLRAATREAAAGAGLQSVHLSALWYLARANRYSDSPAAVAEFLGLTKGTVSQSLQVLERRGYIAKKADAEDKRRVHLRLTRRGRRLLETVLPPPILRDALKQRPPRERQALEEGLAELLRSLQAAHGFRAFGVCRTCRFFTAEQRGYRCGLTLEPLSEADSAKICREHEPAA